MHGKHNCLGLDNIAPCGICHSLQPFNDAARARVAAFHKTNSVISSALLTVGVIFAMIMIVAYPVAPRVGDAIEFGGIQWRVLDTRGSRLLIISEHVLETRPFHYRRVGVTWENSDMRQWLNAEFYTSFTVLERMRIWAWPSWLTDGASDKIFLLSHREAAELFGASSYRVAYDFEGNAAFWWLRSFDGSSRGRVTPGGVISHTGNFVDNPHGVRPAMWIRR